MNVLQVYPPSEALEQLPPTTVGKPTVMLLNGREWVTEYRFVHHHQGPPELHVMVDGKLQLVAPPWRIDRDGIVCFYRSA